tara:strand:- start:287 stop:856 length:570 start_codon:yes stop_codon:yes gene_type:complete
MTSLTQEYILKDIIKYREKGYNWNKIFNLCVEQDENKRCELDLPELEKEYFKKIKLQIKRDYTTFKIKNSSCELIELKKELNMSMPKMLYYLDYKEKNKFAEKIAFDYMSLYKENQSLKQENRNLRLMSKNSNTSSLSRQLLGLIQWYKETTACNVPRLDYLELVGKYGKIEPDEWDTDDEDLKFMKIL